MSTAKIQAQYSANRKAVQYLCAMTDTEYMQFVRDTGRAFVARYYYGKHNSVQISTTDAFGKWWQFCWHDMDDRLILDKLYSVPVDQVFATYRALHQTVFDESNDLQEMLVVDFDNMKSVFEKELREVAV